MIDINTDDLKDELLSRFSDMVYWLCDSLADVDDCNCIKNVAKFKFELEKEGLLTDTLEKYINDYIKYKN